jgi:hypothetical protein
MSQDKERKKRELDALLSLAGPIREGETQEQFYARYGKLNEGLRARLANEPSIQVMASELMHAGMQCTVCGVRGPGANTIYEAARQAQHAGFIRDNKTNFWYCPQHHSRKPGGEA